MNRTLAPSFNSASRRVFIRHLASAASAVGGLGPGAFSCFSAASSAPPISVFTKAYQSLNLTFEQSAETTSEAGLDGIDCPVRIGGEVVAERVAEDLPRYAEALRRHNLGIRLLTTGITSPASPHAETILRTAKKLEVEHYRVGFLERETSMPLEKQLREAKAQLKDLAALNKEVGVCALVQNHSPSGHTYLGGDLKELRELVSDLHPSQVGVAFDIGHALIVHREQWRGHFDAVKSQVRAAYVKDTDNHGRWAPFGQGDIAQSGYFALLKQLRPRIPIVLHLEYDWTDGGKSKTRAALVKALQESSRVLRQWWAQA